MAIELHIFLSSSKLPSLEAWQAEITQNGFSATIEAPFDLRRDSGFRPVSFRGAKTGFEFYLEPARDIVTSYAHVVDAIGERDVCATFRWGGHTDEMCAALSAAASLAKIGDGVYYYPDDDILLSADDALRTTKKDLEPFMKA